ncbi:RNA polymerase I-specific transcription initiation factor rrn7 [Hyphodiscus hymeniophilus]|uniref:RNA polymerase I-specific transcription initiation factor rrn7 n=1 Tax=Hyphodiscus hymeniophilus TaxID=353542 RepID=A0A9P7AXI2_9HELO|nr:RNA polymerase I-specific transcription initiation factor rrn7 [Hyphodiscus hymeniophilus]
MSSQIEYHRFSRHESCTEEGCRSRKWYIEDGRKFCQRGHEQAGFTQTQRDEDDWNNEGKKSRKKREEKERVHTILSGREAQELYLECYQLILWKQCNWLVSVKDFPAGLETVVRDLWGLRVRVLNGDLDGKDGDGSGLCAVEFSTSEGETGSDTTAGRSLWSGTSRKSVVGMKKKLPKLIETLVLCYLGTLLMRLPTSLGEFFKWASKEEIVFSRAIKEVPKEMRSKLPPHFHSALEIHAPLKGWSIYTAVVELMDFYRLHFEMVFPSLNTPLLLFKHMRDLGLPIQRLASLLGFDFQYPIVPQGRHRTISYPEIRLMSLIVVATKLSQPFDEISRYSNSESDPSIVQIDWTRWAQIMAEPPSDGLRRGEEIHVTDKDVFGMSEKAIDDYLNWHQRNWVDDRNSKISQQILDFFPLQEIVQPAVDESDYLKQADGLKQVQQESSLRKSRSIPENDEADFPQPGEYYRRYRSVKDLPKAARAFYGIAARNIGVNVQRLIRGVFQTEIQLENWSLAEKKRRLIEGREKAEEDFE